MRKWRSTGLIILAIVGMFAVAMYFGTRATSGDEAAFVGTDVAATAHIQDANPHYAPWFAPLFEPSSGDVESGLFAAQAALGAGVLGFALGALWQRSRSARADSPVRTQTTIHDQGSPGPNSNEQG